MNNSSTPSLPAAQRDALEARFALRVRTRLDEGAQALPHDIGERLRDVAEAPDGTLYLLTDDRDGQLLRLLPR